MRVSSLVKSLSWSGVIPFVLSTIAILSVGTDIAVPLHIFTIYSALILSFMSGAIWGMAFFATKQAVALQVFSVFYPLLTWLLLLWNAPKITIAVLALGFAHVWILEKNQIQWNKLPAGYRSLRAALTTVVVLCHVIVWFYLFL